MSICITYESFEAQLNSCSFRGAGVVGGLWPLPLGAGGVGDGAGVGVPDVEMLPDPEPCGAGTRLSELGTEINCSAVYTLVKWVPATDLSVTSTLPSRL